MAYDQVCDWAGADFNRLVTARRAARSYRPERIGHQLDNHGMEPTPNQAVALARMKLHDMAGDGEPIEKPAPCWWNKH